MDHRRGVGVGRLRAPRFPGRRGAARFGSPADVMAAAWAPLRAFAPMLAGTRDAVSEVEDFGTNPGGLRMLVYAPPRLPPRAPLVVVLHGCGQRAEDFARDAGWIDLARRLRVSLLLPEQSSRNNASRCFRWFGAAHSPRGGPEVVSIRQMQRAAARRFDADPRRVFVAGFSAGAAMAVTLLANHPAGFAGGAAIAGLPFRSALNGSHALFRMGSPDRLRTRQSWAAAVRAASAPRVGRSWPRLSVWQGGSDRVVAPEHAEALAAQWGELHGWPEAPVSDEALGPGLRRRAWGRAGRPSVELWTLERLGHGVPVDARRPGFGRDGAWVVDAGLCAAERIARFWGLDPDAPA